ncbi:MAG: tRNA 2-thiocytidine biosynthesis protein TtcA [Schwartzia sp.]|nr:tRNA 2-thiocytidine biosynthesis protein TtcA [Schwartzia sp. (in: firmicutes)]
MKFKLPQIYFSKIMRAIVEFDLIDDGDKILIGLSGGKDSILLTYALSMMRERLDKDFSLMAFTINPMFNDSFDTGVLKDFCNSLDMPYESRDINIAKTIADCEDKNPCYTCAFFRRGAINRYALEHGCNKIAYAHHNDDAVETLLMSILYSGQIKTFTPKTYLDRTDLTVIRPLVYLRESESIDAIKYHGMKPLASSCPLDGKTTRQEIKNLIKKLTNENELIYAHLAAAMRKNNIGEMWPAAKTRNEMRDTYFSFFNKENKKR